MSSDLTQIGGGGFEDLKKVNAYGAEYWSARDLQPLLGYSQWRRFENAIHKAVTSCEQSGNDPSHHFAGAGKMVGIGSETSRNVPDYHLSRFACYLIVQNGDSRKPQIANAQKYFAIQTRRQELSDQAAADLERLELRRQTSAEFKALSGAAREAGVQSRMFGVFHDAGYKGLYGGLGLDAIKGRKRIPAKDQLMDRMDTTELAANQFRMTQTRDKLSREGCHNQEQAIRTHKEVGEEVRAAIKRIGGTLPENLPPAEHIKHTSNNASSTQRQGWNLKASRPEDLPDKTSARRTVTKRRPRGNRPVEVLRKLLAMAVGLI
jgi:DNA-damage-inducible protein D